MTGTVLILGASGKIGRHSAQAFQAAGWTVTKYDRQKGNMAEAAKGCDVIVNGLNPPNYHNWETLLPKITTEVIAAARSSGATVILPGNVYHFGDTPGLWSESTPPAPVSKKGRIRLELEQTYAHSGVQTIVLRAGNFIDPELEGCIMSQVYLRALKHGKITLPGPAHTCQAMCYLPDWARAAVRLAEVRAALSPFEDIPFQGHTLTANQIKSGLEDILQFPLRFTNFPWWVFKLSSPLWELARELSEMRYLWNTDHALSDARLKQLLPDFEVTPTNTMFKEITGKQARPHLTPPARDDHSADRHKGHEYANAP